MNEEKLKKEMNLEESDEKRRVNTLRNKLISLIGDGMKEKGFIVLRRARPLIRFRRIM